MDNSKEKQIKELRDKISYLTEKSKNTFSQVEKGLIADQILELRKKIGELTSKKLDRVKRVDIVDAPSVADRLSIKYSRSGGVMYRKKMDIKED